MREITASAFKAGCLALLDEVAASGESLLITKRGRPVARVDPVEEPPSLLGSVSFKASDEELVAPLGDRWDAQEV
jgi:prevent-host-death family protein